MTKSKLFTKLFALTFLSIIAFFFVALVANFLRYSEVKFSPWSELVKSTKVTLRIYNWKIAVTYIVLVIAITFGVFWPELKKKFKWKNKEDEESDAWLYNEYSHEGDYYEFKKQFLVTDKRNVDNANWVLKFSKNLNNWYVNDPQSDINGVILGGVGSGKTQRIILPNIIYNSALDFEHKPNLVITDPKKEIIKFLGSKLEQNDYKVYAIDFSEPQKGLSWNPLSQAYDVAHQQNGEVGENIAKAYAIINDVIESLSWDRSQKDSIWNSLGKKLLITIAKLLLLISLDDENIMSKEYFNFETIASMVNQDAWKWEQNWISITYLRSLDAAKKNDNDPKDYFWNVLWNDVVSLATIVAETLSGVIAQAQTVLKIFTSDELIKAMLRNTQTFNINEIINDNTPFAIFVHYPDHKPANHFLVSMLINQIYQALIDQVNLSKDGKLARPIKFILDEFGNLPTIPEFDNKISISRSRGILFLVVIQDKNQLVTKYGNNAAKIIWANLQLVYFLNSSDEGTIDDFSKSLGTKEVKQTSTTQNKDNTSTTESKKDKAVMSASELKAKKQDYVIVSKIGTKPMMLKTLLTYKLFENDDYNFTNPEVVTKIGAIVPWDYKKLPEVTLPTNMINPFVKLKEPKSSKKTSDDKLEPNKFRTSKRKLTVSDDDMKLVKEHKMQIPSWGDYVRLLQNHIAAQNTNYKSLYVNDLNEAKKRCWNEYLELMKNNDKENIEDMENDNEN